MAKKKPDDVPVMEVMAAPGAEAEEPVIEETAVKEAVEENPGPKFTKKQLMGSKKFSDKRDILGALLKKDQTYTSAECEKLIDEFLKGKV